MLLRRYQEAFLWGTDTLAPLWIGSVALHIPDSLSLKCGRARRSMGRM